ncbi:hypothetical protein CN276_11095 [Bacillus cereus]|nr:hypothetical protein CN276_11095 [Bacillus cereus]
MLSFFAFQQTLIKCEVKIHLEFILVAKDIQEVSTFVSKKYPFSCLSTGGVQRHESRNLFYSEKCCVINGGGSFSTHFLVHILRQENGYFFK